MNRGIEALDLALFCSQLAKIMKAGVGSLNALKIVEGQIDNITLKNAVSDAISKFEEGEMLSDALSHTGVFDPCFVRCIKTADENNELIKCLDEFRVIYENDDKRNALMGKAVYFPIFIATVSVLFVLVTFIVMYPHFMGMFEGIDVEMPAFTKGVYAVSVFLGEYYMIILLVVMALFLVALIYKNSPAGRLRISGYILKKAPFNKVKRRIIYSRFSELLAELLIYDVDKAEALKTLAAEFSKEFYFSDLIDRASGRCSDNELLSSALQETGFFSDMFIEMISLGEEMGNLKNTLLDNHSLFLESAGRLAARKQSFFEPMIIFAVAIILFILVISIAAPLVSLFDAVGRI
ncbi:MAG: type II secretion system F family protein [Lachnospiraceae bacterium]|nr:type II secretion system F family protein [Lachnospiraceae bacterium]